MDGVSRRGFLGAMLALGAAPAIVRAESLMRVRAIVLPGEEEFAQVATAAGNRAISPDVVTRETLRLLHENLRFSATLNCEWDKRESGFVVPSHLAQAARTTVTIRRPRAWMV